DSFFEDYPTFSHWPHAEGKLHVNPLYSPERNDRGMTLRRRFPSDWFEEDNSPSNEYLIESVDVSPGLFEDLATGRRTKEVDALIEQSIVLGFPERYLNVPAGEGPAGLKVTGTLSGGASKE